MVIDVTSRPCTLRCPRSSAACTALIVGCATGPAFAQRGLPPADSPLSQQFETVDEGITDRGSNAVSLRRVEFDLRQDTDFDHLYEAPGRPDLLMRRDGAITAVFSQSLYAISKGGLIPVIPPGALFFIGAPDADDPALPAPIGFTERPAPAATGPDERQNSAPVSLPIDARVSSVTYGPTPYHAAPDDQQALIYMNAERARIQRLREIADRLGPL